MNMNIENIHSKQLQHKLKKYIQLDSNVYREPKTKTKPRTKLKRIHSCGSKHEMFMRLHSFKAFNLNYRGASKRMYALLEMLKS